jgi:23S rRNA (uracil1939-C5)-methyltransferase
MAESVVTVTRLGALGDGVAETANGRLHVPLAAPGDIARVTPAGKDRAELVEILSAGPARVTPPCRHFGRCGGCALQHLAPEFIAEWKRDMVAAALARAGLSGDKVAPTIAIPPATRRRATLAAKRQGKSVVMGFAERRSHRLVDLAECKVLVPALAGLIAPLRRMLADLLDGGETADIALTETDSGIDLVLVRTRPLTLPDLEGLAAFAEVHDLARISWRAATTRRPAEPVAVRRTPHVRLGVHPVPVPPAGFLQPSLAGQTHLIDLVLQGLAGITGPFVDLFAGMGTFSLPLGGLGQVTAHDGDADAVAALKSVRNSGVTAHRRDLFREPLTPVELTGFAAAVIDPPRAGADAQSRNLAASRIPTLAYVSCNPASFARDAAILTAGGYRLGTVTPIDQFAWSPHIELVGIFRR